MKHPWRRLRDLAKSVPEDSFHQGVHLHVDRYGNASIEVGDRKEEGDLTVEECVRAAEEE